MTAQSRELNIPMSGYVNQAEPHKNNPKACCLTDD